LSFPEVFFLKKEISISLSLAFRFFPFFWGYSFFETEVHFKILKFVLSPLEKP
jgi:hypothetical protein